MSPITRYERDYCYGDMSAQADGPYVRGDGMNNTFPFLIYLFERRGWVYVGWDFSGLGVPRPIYRYRWP